MIPWHYSNPERSVESHRASSSRPKDAVKTRKGLLRPENRSRQPRISFWEPAHLASRLRVATGVPRPCFFRAGEGRSPPLAAVENMRKGPQVLYFEASPGGPTLHFSPGEETRVRKSERSVKDFIMDEQLFCFIMDKVLTDTIPRTLLL